MTYADSLSRDPNADSKYRGVPSIPYDFGDVRKETFEECQMRYAASGQMGRVGECAGKPKQIVPIPEELFQKYLRAEEGKGKDAGEFLDNYVADNDI